MLQSTGVRAQSLERGGGAGRGAAGRMGGGGGAKKKKNNNNFQNQISFFSFFLYARLPQCLEYSKECILLIMFLTVYANTESNLVCCTGQLVTTCIFAINRPSTKHVPSIHFYICSIVIFDSR